MSSKLKRSRIDYCSSFLNTNSLFFSPQKTLTSSKYKHPMIKKAYNKTRREDNFVEMYDDIVKEMIPPITSSTKRPFSPEHFIPRESLEQLTRLRTEISIPKDNMVTVKDIVFSKEAENDINFSSLTLSQKLRKTKGRNGGSCHNANNLLYMTKASLSPSKAIPMTINTTRMNTVSSNCYDDAITMSSSIGFSTISKIGMSIGDKKNKSKGYKETMIKINKMTNDIKKSYRSSFNRHVIYFPKSS